MKQAAGLLVYRRRGQGVEVLLAHPGGPFWAHKDEWSIPKGEVEEGETLRQAMEREFIEEIGIDPPLDNNIELGMAPAHDRTNHIWAVEANLDLSKFNCESLVTLEWPPRTGRSITFPENDRAEWFDMDTAKAKIFKTQTVFLERLQNYLAGQK